MFHLRSLYDLYASLESDFHPSFQFRNVGALAIVAFYEIILAPANLEPYTTSLNEDTLKVCRSHLQERLDPIQYQYCLQSARCFLLFLFEADYCPIDYSHLFKPTDDELGSFSEEEYRKKWH